jgi:hypothetical protein
VVEDPSRTVDPPSKDLVRSCLAGASGRSTGPRSLRGWVGSVVLVLALVPRETAARAEFQTTPGVGGASRRGTRRGESVPDHPQGQLPLYTNAVRACTGETPAMAARITGSTRIPAGPLR